MSRDIFDGKEWEGATGYTFCSIHTALPARDLPAQNVSNARVKKPWPNMMH